MSYNKITVMGRLVANPEVKTFGEKSVCEVRVAFDNGWGDNKKTCFIGATAWGKTGEFVSKHFKTGDGILFDGRLEFDQWEDKNGGGKRSKHYITMDRATFPLSNSGGNTGTRTATATTTSANTTVDTNSIPF